MTILKLFLYIVVFSILFLGCKKYPEDKTLVHFRKPEKRLKYGTDWKITEYKVNGVDSFAYVNSKNFPGIKIEDIKFERLLPGYFQVYSTGCDIYFNFQSDKRTVSLGYTPEYPITYPLFFSGRNDWKIKRLDHEVFTIEIDKNGKNYRVTFSFVK